MEPASGAGLLKNFRGVGYVFANTPEVFAAFL